MQTYIGDILTNARRDSRNADDIPSSTNLVGIQTEDFLRYANWAQQRLQGRISKVYPYVFEAQKEISMVANQASYSITDNVYLNTRIRKVEYSRSGNSTDYYPLTPNNPYYTYNGTGVPSRYHRRDGYIIVEPTPNSSAGTIRVTYERALDRLDIRRGVVTAVTLSSTQLTALTIDTASDDTTALAAPISKYLCINDANGNVKMYNVPFTSYASGTGIFTLSAFTFASGESAAIGDYVTLGRYTTTHSKLCEDAERYLTEYVNRRIFKRDSSSDAADVDTELNDIEQELITSYKIADKDIKEVPIADYSWFNVTYGWDS